MVLFQPILLNDKSRLQEIYDLRVEAWESSDRNGMIVKSKYPNGWSEDIDNDAFHFVIIDDTNTIVASSRISIHNSISELPYPKAFEKFELPDQRPFAFYSRLVVAPKYRGSLFFKKLDHIRIQFLKDNNLSFAIATCKEKRLNSMILLGFEILGKTSIEYLQMDNETALILLLKNINY